MFYKILLPVFILMVYLDIIIIAGLASAFIILSVANVYAFGILKANGAYVFVVAWAKIIFDLYFWYTNQKKQLNGHD